MKLRMLVKRGSGKFKSTHHHESGMMLIEALVALAVLGLTSVVFLDGLAITAKSDFISNERSQAGSLANSQMEFIKAHSYINWVPGHEVYDLITAPTNYNIQVTTVPIDHYTGQPLPSGDNGTQQITVVVTHQSKSVITITDYKVNR